VELAVRPGAHAHTLWVLLHRRPQQDLAHPCHEQGRRPPGNGPAPPPDPCLRSTSTPCRRTADAAARALPPPGPESRLFCGPNRAEGSPMRSSDSFSYCTRGTSMWMLSDPRTRIGAVQQRVRDALLIAADHHIATSALFDRVTIVAARTGVHGADKHKSPANERKIVERPRSWMSHANRLTRDPTHRFCRRSCAPAERR